MIVTIALSIGDGFSVDIGDEGMDAAACINATRELLKGGELLHGQWGSAKDYNKASAGRNRLRVVPAYINLDFVVAISV